MVIKEYRSLENQAIFAKNPAKKLKMKKLCVLLGCQYVAYIEGNPRTNTLWKPLYLKCLAVLTKGLNDDPNKGDDRLIWMKELTGEISGELKSMDESDIESLPELVTCLKAIVNSELIVKTAISIEESQDEETNEQINDITNEALNICCERSYPLFLHLLIDYVGMDPNAIIDNNMLNTRPVHKAASNGKSGTLVYLHYTHNVPLDQMDKNQNNPAHLAFLN